MAAPMAGTRATATSPPVELRHRPCCPLCGRRHDCYGGDSAGVATSANFSIQHPNAKSGMRHLAGIEIRLMGLGLRVVGFGVKDLEFRVSDLEFGV